VETGQGQLTKKKSWEGANIKILQNLTVDGRRLSGRIGNETIVPQGVMWTSSQGLEIWRATDEVKCTAHSRERRISWRQYGVLFRSLTAKNREKARERNYFPVCLHLTQMNGDRFKRLDDHE
jgi:hypothetical protein